MHSFLYLIPAFLMGALAAPATTPTTSAVGAPDYTQAYLYNGTSYINAVLFHHNRARRNFGSSDLKWNATLADNALQAAKRCSPSSYFPPGTPEQGQNIFGFSSPWDGPNATYAITNQWYLPNFAKAQQFAGSYWTTPGFNVSFSIVEILWASTTSVGCASFNCGSVGAPRPGFSYKFTYCNYFPRARYTQATSGGKVVQDSWVDNVKKPISTTNLGSWTDSPP